MKASIYVSVIFCFLFSAKGFSQELNIPNMCKPLLDTAMMQDVLIDEAIKWSESKPLTVKCDNGKSYVLHRFNVSIFTKKPLQTIEYGTGEEGGIPILARNAIMRAKPGDTVIFKNVIYIDENAEEQQLPVISFKLQ
jgi:hypothetical protein